MAGVTLQDDRMVLDLRGSGVSLAPLVRLIVENGGQIEEVRRASRSLEDVFLDLVKQN